MKKVMILFSSLVLILFSALPVPGQQATKPQTKLEELFLLKSSLIIKEFYPIKKKELPDTVSFDWIVVKMAGKEAKPVSGLRVEIIDYSRSISNKNAVFLDLEEVKDLIPSIDYMQNLISQYKNEPPKTYIEVQFSTKGDFKIGFYCEGKEMKGFMSAGSISPTSSFFGVEKLAVIKTILEEALKAF